jgi:5'-nucleotidase (lipoprotein e(P4) family)
MNHKNIPIVASIIAALLLNACATPAAKPPMVPVAQETTSKPSDLAPSDNLNAVLWQQTAAEYHAHSLQSFKQAQLALELLLKQPTLSAAVEQTGNFSGLPPAVVVDVDETMLDNSAYQARLIKSGASFVESDWAAWCNERAALALPGAREFSNFANSRGVRIIYLSNRDVSLTEVTRQNLAELGFSDSSNTSTFLFRDKANQMDTKGQRRLFAAQKYRLVMLIGDNLGDFNEDYKATVAARRTLVTDFSDYWGSRWIMIANPTYGSWEQSLYGFDNTLTPAMIRQKKLDALRLQQLK